MKRYYYIWFAGIFPFFFSVNLVFSQPEFYNIEVFTIDEGLSQSYTNVIHIDSKGFIWIGTKDGINKFNGYTFEKYRNDPADSTSLVDNYITCVTEDKSGTIWMGTKGGLSRYDRKNDQFINYTNNASDRYSISGNEIFDLMVDKENTLWIKTRYTLDHYDTKNNNFRHYKHYYSVFNIKAGEKSYPLLEGDEGDIYVGTKDGLSIFNKNNQEFYRLFHKKGDPSSISNDVIKCIHRDHDGIIWVGTEDGLNIFNRSTKTFKTYTIGKGNPASNQINDIYTDSDGLTWLATNDGLVYFSKELGKYSVLNKVDGYVTSVDLTIVYSIKEDKTKILWLATPAGLIKIDKKKPKMKLLNMQGDNYPSALHSQNITSILVDNSNCLWLGTYGEGVIKINNISGSEIQYIEQPTDGLSLLRNKQIYSMLQDKKGIIWIGTDHGVYLYNPVEKSLKDFCEMSTVIPCNIFENRYVYTILEDQEGNVWFGTSRGVHKFDRKYEIVNSIFQIQNEEIIEIDNVYSLHEDYQGNIWFGCDKGLIKYDKKKNIFYHFNNESHNRYYRLMGSSVYCMVEDDAHILWLGTSNGLHAFHPDSGIIASFTTDHFLPNNLVNSIEIDPVGKLWISTNKGISTINPRTGVVKNFDIRDGLQGYEFNLGASFIDRNGRLYFGGTKGLNYFYEDSMEFNLHTPPVEISALEFFGSKRNERYHIEDRDEIVIPFGRYMFNIYFSALDYTFPERNHYAYKMYRGGDEGEWIHIGNYHYASFSNISPGEYIFHVIGSNSDDVWNNEGKKIKIIVKPPVWQTSFAYVIYILFTFFTINIFLRYRTKSLRSANKILKEKELAGIQIAKQKEELSIQNKNIRDSINYARRIQQAILPSEKVFKTYLADSFVYYKPKDIVSGDFYWIQEIHGKIYLSAVDCTGHGVPGAFMSIIGYELFRRLRSFRNLEDPAKILTKLNDDFGEIFKDIENISLKDGMDVALCIIDKESKRIKYSGAFSPFYIVRDDKVIEIKGDRYSVGVDELNLEVPQFTTHEIVMQPGDIYYIFSDGYADQFGGPEGKKYKFRRFRHLLLSVCHLPFDVQKYMLEESMEEWRGDHEQVDDIMVLGFKL